VRARILIGALVGLLSAAVALGAGEFASIFVRPAASPVIAVGNRVIVLTPEPVKRAVIGQVGTDDKLLLLTGIYVAIAIFAAAVGVVALRTLLAGLAGFAVFGAFGAYCALTAAGSEPSDALPSVVGTAGSLIVLTVLVRLARTAVRPGPTADPSGASASTQPARRSLLLAGLGTAALAGLAGFGGHAATQSRFNVAAKRRAVRLPPVSPVAPHDPPPSAHTAAADSPDLGVSGVPWATANADFYRIDTALTVPQLDPDTWTLRIHGMVERELTLTWAQLLARPMIERWITLCCVSNTIGGNLIGNALFQGVRLADLLREAGLRPNADQLLLTSADGYSFGAPVAVVMDGRDALLAVGMNRVPLPIEHGFPVRSIVPGLYGYVSACKWLVDIEATTFARSQGYWVHGGWAPEPTLQLSSRIDTPRDGQTVRVGVPTAVAGVAWDQHVGISAVDVQAGAAPWQTARLAAVPSTDTWRQWTLIWTPPAPGTYRLRVRATDARGHPQEPRYRAPFPAGATGLHTITVHARA
jgi:DMSO/TMAO reductase YedYZ molybdopterin-dependent catalytic subunit